jgi:hypothetical protein
MQEYAQEELTRISHVKTREKQAYRPILIKYLELFNKG